MSIPPVSAEMTRLPFSIDANATLREAQQKMEQEGVRHLPVTESGKIVGIISDRDIKSAFDPIVEMPPMRKVRSTMSVDPYIVPPYEPLDDVLSTLAERKIGCAIVADEGKLAGIFTTIDAARMLAERLRDENR